MGKLFYLLVTALLILLCAPMPALAEEWRLSLGEAVGRALAENRDIKIAKERLIELYGMKGEARAMGLPQLTGTGSYERMWRRPEIELNGLIFQIGATNTVTAGATATQLLFDGGKVFRAVKAAKLEEARGIQTIKDAEAQVQLAVKETFHEILFADKLTEVLDRQHRQLVSHLNSIRTRFKKGIDSDYTLMRQEVEVANIEPQIIDARRNKELLANAMKVLLAIPQTDTFAPKGEFDYKAVALPPAGTLIEKAVESRPDLKAENLRARSLKLNVGIEKTGYIPTLDFSASYLFTGLSNDFNFNSDNISDSFNTILNFSWPIFDGLKTHSRVKQAKAKHMQQILATSQMEDNVAKQVRDYYEMLIKARESLAVQRKSLDLARRVAAIAGERFEAGLMSQIELNDTITAQALSEQNYIRAALDCLNSQAALEKAVGGEL